MEGGVGIRVAMERCEGEILMEGDVECRVVRKGC